MSADRLSGYSPTQEFWATRYTQLDLQFVSLHVTVDHIAGGFVSRPDPGVRLDHNRAIKVQHAEQFASYLVRGAEDETGKWSVVVPALSLWANPTGVEFRPDTSISAIDPIEFGVFSVLRTTPIGIWDGQHRVLGMYIAVARKEDEISDLADKHAKAAAAGSAEASELEEHLKKAQDQRRRLGAITVPLSVALETDKEKIATLFADVADNAKGINATALGRLDHRQVFNRVAGRLVTGAEGWTLLDGLVDDDNAYTTRNNAYWTTWRDVVDVARTLWLGYGARWSEQQEQARLANEEEDILTLAQEFYEVLEEAFPDIEDVLNGTVLPRDLRGGGERTSLLASSTTIKALASAYHDLRFGKAWVQNPETRRFGRLTNLPEMARDDIAAGFANLPSMDSGAESKLDPYWKSLGIFEAPWAAPTARAGNIRTLGVAATEYVRDHA